MPNSTELDNLEEPKFNWGRKRGRGGTHKQVQFYESFTYDEVEYALYDCVYMYNEPTPYIGKLVKIWEGSGESKKVKIHWFFRPSEISYYLKDIEVADNELFFATGEGAGLTNVNPLSKSTWLRESPWEERLRESHDLGKLVLLLNLDPEYTSGEVEDIIWHAFNEKCSAKMIQRTAVSSPHSGQAFVIFKTKEAAEKVIRKLDDGCLMLSNGRPLVACYGVLPRVSERQTSSVGHLAIGDVRRQTQRDAQDAVSTSHYSQANTIEYEMAMEWCLLQSRSDIWWKMLYEEQKEVLRKLRANLKTTYKLERFDEGK